MEAPISGSCTMFSRTCADVGYIIVGLVICHILACHFLPKAMVYITSQPYASQIKWNLGPGGLEFQSVLYEIYHQTRIAKWTHWLTLGSVHFAWFVLIAHLDGHWETMVFLNALLCAQVLTFKNRLQMTMLMIPFNTVCAGFALWIAQFGSSSSDHDLSMRPALWWAEVTILFGSAIRCLGHTLEAYPPFMMDNSFSKGWQSSALWVSLRNPLKGIVSLTAGFSSELAGGIPGRLLPGMIHILILQNLQRDNSVRDSQQNEQILPNTVIVPFERKYYSTWHEIYEVGRKILDTGSWEAYFPTSRQFASEIRIQRKKFLAASKAEVDLIHLPSPKLPLAISADCDQSAHLTVVVPQVPKFWKNLFHAEVVVYLAICYSWQQLIMRDHSSSHQLGSSAAFQSWVTRSAFIVLSMQLTLVAINLTDWLFYPAVQGNNKKKPLRRSSSADLYRFCDLQEVMMILDALMVIVGINMKYDLGAIASDHSSVNGSTHHAMIYGHVSTSGIGLLNLAHILVAFSWFMIRFAFLSEFDIRTIEPREN